MRTMLRVVLVVVLAVSAAGCEASALRYAKKKNPGCDVTVLAETKDSVRVAVKCPTGDPFERVYREQ